MRKYIKEFLELFVPISIATLYFLWMCFVITAPMIFGEWLKEASVMQNFLFAACWVLTSIVTICFTIMFSRRQR